VSQAEKLGELRGAIEGGAWAGGTPPELGAIVTGSATGRRDPRDVTIADLTGTGAQDTAIATHVAARLGDAGTLVRA
jgi:ornithine cyclodeaminase